MQRLSSLSEVICPGSGKVRFGCRNGMDAIGDYVASLPEAGLEWHGCAKLSWGPPWAPLFGR